MCPGLQPYAPEAATLSGPGCTPPRAQAATLCVSGDELQRVRGSCTDQLRAMGAELATAQAELEAARRGVAAQLEATRLEAQARPTPTPTPTPNPNPNMSGSGHRYAVTTRSA